MKSPLATPGEVTGLLMVTVLEAVFTAVTVVLFGIALVWAGVVSRNCMPTVIAALPVTGT